MKAITVEPKKPGTARCEDAPEPDERDGSVLVGSVNANKRHWYKAAQDLARADRAWLSRLVSRRERPEDFARALRRSPEDVKVVVAVRGGLTRDGIAPG